MSVCCVGILVACFFSRDKGEEFTPDTQIPESTVSEWEEPIGEAKTPEAGTGAYNQTKEVAVAETYPKVAEESEAKIVVDFALLLRKANRRLPKNQRHREIQPIRKSWLLMNQRKRNHRFLKKRKMEAMLIRRSPEAKMKREKSMFPDLAGLHSVQ